MTAELPTQSPLIGRAPHLERLAEHVAATRAGHGSSVIVRGEPGVGKTSLIREATALATDFLVLRCSGVEAEVELPFGGLHELLLPLRSTVNELPDELRLALQSALAMDTAQPASIVTASMGTLDALASAAAAQPLLLVVDDVHWMDEATLLVLAFVARRIGHDRVLLLMAGRPVEADATVPGERLELSPLSAQQAAELAERQLQRPIPDDTAAAIAAATGGNPLAVIETMRLLGDQLDRFGTVLDEPPPPGQLIEQGFAHRLAGLSPETRLALAIISAALTDSASTLLTAINDLGLERSALDQAEQAGVIVREFDSLTFSHPLLRSLVYHDTSPATRRRCNSALASVTVDRGSRAWHAAGATAEADETLAAELAEAARDFQTRGGMLAAARAFERAARLSPGAAERAERLHDAGRHARFAGRTAWAHELLDEAYDSADGHAALRLQVESSRISLVASSGSNAGLVARALRLADDAMKIDTDLAADALGMVCDEGILAGDGPVALAALKRLDALPPISDVEIAHEVANMRVTAALHFGTQPAAVRELAIQTARTQLSRPSAGLSGVAIIGSLIRLEEDEWARGLIDHLLHTARASGDLVALSAGLLYDAMAHYHRGDWARADLAIEHAVQLAGAVDARLDALLSPDDEYRDRFERALAQHVTVTSPFDRARTHLHYGRRLRRSGKRTQAGEQLAAALKLFTELGARPWAAQAKSELGVSSSARTGTADGVHLTAQERVVADCVAQGMTNKEAAAQLFLTTKTIEWHLRQIYRKLGIKSRTQLAARMHAQGLVGGGGAAPTSVLEDA